MKYILSNDNFEVDGKQYLKGVGGYSGSNAASSTDLASVINGKASSSHSHGNGTITGGTSGYYLKSNGSSSSSSWSPIYDTDIVFTSTTNLKGKITPIDMAMSALHSANRLELCKASGVTVEYSTNGGTSWVDYGLNDDQKVNLCGANGFTVYGGAKGSSTSQSASDMLRVTLTASDMGVYTAPDKMLINFSTSYSKGCSVKVETAKKSDLSAFTEYGVYPLEGWSGWNSIPLVLSTFGGGASQLSNTGVVRLTFSSTGFTGTSTQSGFQVMNILMFGKTFWSTPSNIAKTGHLYSYDAKGNATFPGSVSATTFNGYTIAKSVPSEAVFTDTACTQTGHYSPTTVSTTVGNTSQQTPSHGDTFNIPFIKYDSKGHIVSADTTTVKLPNSTDTKNTAGATDNLSAKLFLVGAPSQDANPQTYSQSTVYMQDGMIYLNNESIITQSVFDELVSNIEDNEEVVSTALNALNSSLTSLEDRMKVGALEQLADDFEDLKYDIINNITVHNAERIGGSTIDDIIEQLGGGIGGGNFSPSYKETTTAVPLIGYELDEAVYSEVQMTQNQVWAPGGFYQKSDERLKTFVSDVEVDLDKITALPKKYFYWNSDDNKEMQIGTSAQAVKELYPEMVNEDKDGYLNVDYDKLVVVALKAIDILNEERKQMKSDIEQIKAKLGL